jgi:hypothetical protein
MPGYALSWVGQLEVEAGWMAGSWVLAVAACFLWWQMIPGDGFPIAACRQEAGGAGGGGGGPRPRAPVR